MTKSKGVGRGGARPGAGRKPKPPIAIPLSIVGKSVDELMEYAVREAAARGHWDEVSKRGARLATARARQPVAAGKKQQRQASADALAQGGSRFAPPPPPSKQN